MKNNIDIFSAVDRQTALGKKLSQTPIEKLIGFENNLKELAEEAGLYYWNTNDEGKIEWVGTEKAWRRFNDLKSVV